MEFILFETYLYLFVNVSIKIVIPLTILLNGQNNASKRQKHLEYTENVLPLQNHNGKGRTIYKTKIYRLRE